MAKSWNRIETWLTLIVLGVGGVILAVAGLWVYVSATATPLHPDPQQVASATLTSPGPQWSGAVEQARQLMRAGVSEQNLPGVAVAVGVNGEIIWAEGFGWSDIEKKAAVEPRTRFRIGTLSIPLTSAAAGLLLEQERLKLDEPIQTYVPEFPRKDTPITLRQVMAHTAGIPNDGGDESALFAPHCDRPVDALPHFADRSLRFDPGSEYRYTRYGWILASAAIEKAAGEPFLTFMQTQVFDRLGMNDTSADTSVESVAADRATSYFPRFAADPRYGPDPMRGIDLSCYAGSSAFVSTAPDLARFAMAMSRGKFLQPATVQLLQSSQRLPSGQETGYGLGWDLESADVAGQPARLVGHDGDLLGGIASSLVTLPEHGIVVVLLSNTSYADTPALALKVATAFVEHANPATRR